MWPQNLFLNFDPSIVYNLMPIQQNMLGPYWPGFRGQNGGSKALKLVNLRNDKSLAASGTPTWV